MTFFGTPTSSDKVRLFGQMIAHMYVTTFGPEEHRAFRQIEKGRVHKFPAYKIVASDNLITLRGQLHDGISTFFPNCTATQAFPGHVPVHSLAVVSMTNGEMIATICQHGGASDIGSPSDAR